MTYQQMVDSLGNKKSSYGVRIPYYFNLAPDRDLLVALNFMSSRRFIYEGKYRQLIAPKISPKHKDSKWTIEGKYLPEDKVTSLQRWLLNFSNEICGPWSTDLAPIFIPDGFRFQIFLIKHAWAFKNTFFIVNFSLCTY